MTGSHIKPEYKSKAITLRAAGYTITVISDMTGISVSSLKRLFSENNVAKGKLKKDVVDKAKSELIQDATTIENIKHEISALILDDIALVKRLRQVMAEATDKLIANNVTEALQVMRAASSGAVALKSTSETLRKTLGIDKDDTLGDELPELKVTIMTDDEVEEVRELARDRMAGFSLDSQLDADDGYDDVVIYDELTETE